MYEGGNQKPSLENVKTRKLCTHLVGHNTVGWLVGLGTFGSGRSSLQHVVVENQRKSVQCTSWLSCNFAPAASVTDVTQQQQHHQQEKPEPLCVRVYWTLLLPASRHNWEIGKVSASHRVNDDAASALRLLLRRCHHSKCIRILRCHRQHHHTTCSNRQNLECCRQPEAAPVFKVSFTTAAGATVAWNLLLLLPITGSCVVQQQRCHLSTCMPSSRQHHDHCRRTDGAKAIFCRLPVHTKIKWNI